MRQLLNRILPNQILNDQRLSRTSKFVYFAMRSHRKTTMKLFAAAIGIPYSSVRHCIHELKRFDWVYSFRDANTGESIYVPHMPLDLERVVAAQTEQYFDIVSNRGEQLMKAVLDIIVDDDRFMGNVRPAWTALGPGDTPLEFDRIYPESRVAIEFQGRQHYEEVTFPDGNSDLKRQQALDRRKALAYLRQQFTLVEIADIELSYETLVAKLDGLLPLISPLTTRPLFRTLNNLCHEHANWAKEKRMA